MILLALALVVTGTILLAFLFVLLGAFQPKHSGFFWRWLAGCRLCWRGGIVIAGLLLYLYRAAVTKL